MSTPKEWRHRISPYCRLIFVLGAATSALAQTMPVTTIPRLPECTAYGDLPAATYGQYPNVRAPVVPALDSQISCLPVKDASGNTLATGKMLSDPSVQMAFRQYDYYNTIPPKGQPSYYLRDGCEWMPTPPPGSKPITDSLPLVVFLHPSMATPDILDGSQQAWATPDLLRYIDTPDILKPGQPGFVVLAPQGRVTYHFFRSDLTYGSNLVVTDTSGTPIVDLAAYRNDSLHRDTVNTGWDSWNRNTRHLPYTTRDPLANLDVVALDHFIGEELRKTMVVTRHGKAVTVPKIDRKRIYLVGWSNGGSFAWMYGLNRRNIAAMGLYSSSNPYAVHNDPCEQAPVSRFPSKNTAPFSQLPAPSPEFLAVLPPRVRLAAPNIPVFHIHNYCDVGGIAPNINNFQDRLAAQGNRHIEDVNIQWQASLTSPQLNQIRMPSGSYDPSCGSNVNADGPYSDAYETTVGMTAGATNHARWPNQWMVHQDSSGNDDGTGMFAFLKNHPLQAH
jgi:hypothetical protein